MQHPTSTSSPAASTTAKRLEWLSGLTLLATVLAVIVLAVTGNSSYLAPVIGIGTAAAAVGGTIQVSIRIRR
ncbi:hypothetical protein [Streptomyces flavidovirens]|uniref:hypothetical protein n=1 Tax=Streptomyces flavidovirens TaxID=67298 RepID=UPI0036878902